MRGRAIPEECGMIPLLVVAAVCTVGVMIDACRLVWLSWHEDKKATILRHEALRAYELCKQAKELHRLAPSRETRLLVVLGEASCDLIAAIQAEDWETARAFKNQVETVEALLTIRVPEAQPMEPWHRDLVESAWTN
jgi:hypothetical protein